MFKKKLTNLKIFDFLGTKYLLGKMCVLCTTNGDFFVGDKLKRRCELLERSRKKPTIIASTRKE